MPSEPPWLAGATQDLMNLKAACFLVFRRFQSSTASLHRRQTAYVIRADRWEMGDAGLEGAVNVF